MRPKIITAALIAVLLSLPFWGVAWAVESDLVWSTFLGGSERDQGQAIALDSYGNLYLAGTTRSDDFPVTSGAYDTSYSTGYSDVFIVKFDLTGSELSYATFLGGVAGGQSRRYSNRLLWLRLPNRTYKF